MEYFEKKITYLRGLCDGSDFPAESKEGKIFHGILDVLDDMAFMLETFMDDEDLVMEDEDLDETDEPIFFYSFNCPSCDGNSLSRLRRNSADWFRGYG